MKRLNYVALWLAVLVVIAVAMLIFESDMLWKVQSMNLFLSTSMFFHQQMVVPAGMLIYAGTFLTQLLFRPWLGVAVLCALWMLLMWLTKRAFRIPARWAVLMLVPIALLTVMNMSMGYWVYLLKLRGWFFVPTLGMTLVAALLWAFRMLPRRWWVRACFVVLTVIVGYPLAGIYALAAALLMSAIEMKDAKSVSKWEGSLLLAVAVFAVVAVPVLYYRFVFHQTYFDYIYRAGLPMFWMRNATPQYYIPYALLAVVYLVFSLTTFGERKNVKRAPSFWRDYLPQMCLLAVLTVAVVLCWYKDENFHHELRMARCLEHSDWEGVLKEGTKQKDEPTRAIVMMHNLALSRLGRQCDEMYRFPKGSKQANSPIPIYMYHVAGRLIYYQYGMLNNCHRMCLEEGVELGWRVEHLQYLTRCALLNGEKQSVRNYLDILRHTMFYGRWADHMETLLLHPEQIAKARETEPVTHMLHYDNRLGSDNGYVEKYLMTLLAKLDSDDPYFQEQAVLGALWARDPELFWPRFIQYAKLHPKDAMPRIFQEAAYLFGNMQHLDIINKIPFRQEVKDNFVSFMQKLQQCEGMPIEQARALLYPSYGDTYFYEYFFLKDITYY